MKAIELFVKAAEKFIEKVETGRARSTETYNDLKVALEQARKEERPALITKAPEEITVAQLECIVMPQGEVICAGKRLGYVTGERGLGRYLTRREGL